MAQPFPLVPFWVVVHVCCSVLNVDPVEGIRSCVQSTEAVSSARVNRARCAGAPFEPAMVQPDPLIGGCVLRGRYRILG